MGANQNVPNYVEQGGARSVIGGSLDVVAGGEINIESGGALKLAGTDVTPKLTELTLIGFPVAALDGSTGKKACLTNGLSVIVGGDGIADMTIGAPVPGDIAIIRIGSITDGKSVVVTAAENVKLSGNNVKATFDAAEEALVLVYKAANTWEVALNIGGVVLAAS